MNWAALFSSFAVHAATAMLAFYPMPAGNTTYGKSGVGAGGGSCRTRASHPQLFMLPIPRILIAGYALHTSAFDYGPRIAGPYCPWQTTLDREAQARFALSGPQAPFSWIEPVGPNPELCIRIEADGSVSHVRMLESSGEADVDSRVARGAMILQFEAAQRAGHPTAAWHRLTINRPLGTGIIEPVPPIVAY
ncbi:MAG: energy transducer TonB [Sphingosinicella sp.]|uniref:energy transducer TonB n=1 Tax=Sphingosinicella sp. TaxID=1917971 RepID=UPI004037EB2B